MTTSKDWDRRRRALIKEHGLDRFHSSYRDQHMTIDLISTPAELRGEGRAAAAMAGALAWADAHGVTVTLTPTAEFGASKTRLTKWYRSLGFVANKGRNKDFRFTDAMLRVPRSRS